MSAVAPCGGALARKCYVFDVARARGSHRRSSRARARGFTTALLLLSSIRTDSATRH